MHQWERRVPAKRKGLPSEIADLAVFLASDNSAYITGQAIAIDGGYRINGSKAWITNGGRADFYTLFARTGEGSKGVSCFLVPRDTEGLSFGKPEEKMGLRAVPTTSANYDGAFVPAERRIGDEGQGLPIAFSALDSGRLGIAAVAWVPAYGWFFAIESLIQLWKA